MYFFFLSYFNKFLKNTSFPKNVNFVMIDFFFFKLKKVYDVRCFKETPAVSNDNAITSIRCTRIFFTVLMRYIIMPLKLFIVKILNMLECLCMHMKAFIVD